MACTVKRYDCPRNADAIDEYAGIAEEQLKRNQNFVSIFPWRKQCDGIDWNYVASAPNGIICGWLSCNISNRFGYKYIYIEEISTRRIKDDLYGGVGTRLHDALLADAKAEGMDFIYLSPLNEDVAAIYAKWGYIRPRSNVKQQFYILKRMPPSRLLDRYMPESPRALLVRAHALAMQQPKDTELVELIELKRGSILELPELLGELSVALDSIVDAETYEEMENINDDDKMTLDDKRMLISEVLEKVPLPSLKGKSTRKARKQLRKTRRST